MGKRKERERDCNQPDPGHNDFRFLPSYPVPLGIHLFFIRFLLVTENVSCNLVRLAGMSLMNTLAMMVMNMEGERTFLRMPF